MQSLGPVIATLKTGSEALMSEGKPIDVTLADFWAWAYSDLLGNTERGVLAEFIVAAALEVATDVVREGWANWDLTTRDAVRIEVKSAAYLQAWSQKELSKISFSTRETKAWDADSGYADAARRQADVYVFALLAHADKTTVNPLDLDQWTFYVLPTGQLNDLTPSQRTISLRTLQQLALPTTFGGLREAVQAAAQPRPSP